MITKMLIPGFLKTGLVNKSTHSTTWQFKGPLKTFIIHSKYFPDSDWLKAHA